jgi:serine protease AprX
MATPVVSGAAVLLLQKTPALTPDQVKAKLMRTATKNFPASSVAVDPVTNMSYTSYYDIFTIGAGYLDISAALADTTVVASGNAISPTAYYDSATGNITLQSIGAEHVIWGTNLNWADTHVIWGTSVVWDETTTDSAQSTPVAVIGEQ